MWCRNMIGKNQVDGVEKSQIHPIQVKYEWVHVPELHRLTAILLWRAVSCLFHFCRCCSLFFYSKFLYLKTSNKKNVKSKNKICFEYFSVFRDSFFLYHLVLHSSVIIAFSPFLDLSYAHYLWQACIFQYDPEMSGIFKKKKKKCVHSKFIYMHSLVLNMQRLQVYNKKKKKYYFVFKTKINDDSISSVDIVSSISIDLLFVSIMIGM